MEAVDLYEILEISRDATSIEIRKAYKRLALVHHPDKVPESDRPEAEIRFKLISEAYNTLINEDLRAQYDQFGSAGNDFPNWQDYYDPGFGPDAFAEFFGFNGSSAAPPRTTRRTANAQFDVELSLEDVFKSRVIKVGANRQVICKHCQGSGGRAKAKPKICGKCDGSGMIEKLKHLSHGLMTSNRVPCDACNGKGSFYRTKDLCKRCNGKTTVEEKSVLEVFVPRGAVNGHQIVFKGKADEAVGKETGDIVVTVRVADHPQFTRQGQDLYTNVQISLAEALVGFSKVLVKHLDGRGLKVTVPRGTVSKPGSFIKIRNQGMASPSGRCGDLYLELNIQFPDRLDPSLVDTLSQAFEVPAQARFNGEVEDVDHQVLRRDDLPEYRSESSEGGSDGGCAQM